MDDSTNTSVTMGTPSPMDAAVTSGATDVLTTIIKALEPLTSEERQRTVGAAMLFLGEATLPKQHSASGDPQDDSSGDSESGYPLQVAKWMKQNAVSAEALEEVFHFNQDGTFDLLNAPGKSKKDQTLNTYILTGLGKYLSTSANERTFDDAMALKFCKKIGCFDESNHARYIKNRPEFTGDRSKGFSLTNPGVKRGAALVKEAAGSGG